MHQAYGLPINPELGVRLLGWHKDDPPSQTETRHNDKIEEIQGTRNLFIDSPALADNLTFSVP